MNMSYCQFENTLLDLKQCLKALRNREISSESEKKKAEKMINDFLDFLVEEGIAEEIENEDRIKEIINECK